METKACVRCKAEKVLSQYFKDKNTKDGFARNCKECFKEMHRKWYVKNKEKKIAYLKERNSNLSEDEKLKAKQTNDKYYQDNRDKILAKRKGWTQREEVREQIRDYQNEKRKKDVLYALAQNIRGSIGRALKLNKYSKKSRTYKILGCSFDELKVHLEKRFVGEMSWVNRGDWHIDHIIPSSSAKKEAELIALNYYINLQPMWKSENLSKGNNYDSEEKRKYLDWYSVNVKKIDS